MADGSQKEAGVVLRHIWLVGQITDNRRSENTAQEIVDGVKECQREGRGNAVNSPCWFRGPVSSGLWVAKRGVR